MITLMSGQHITFPYENYRGETSIRDVVVKGIQYGSNDWYPEPQWFVICWDYEKNTHRSFALNKIDPATIKLLDY